jgi:sulfoxide reductase heme-binding subunit YedZ
MLAVVDSQILWYVSRGTGLVLMVLLTAVVLLGIAVRANWGGLRGQRFVVEGVHRNLSIVALALLVVHVVTAIADPFVHIGWLASIVPFTSPYRTVWIALGTLSVDVLAVVVVTSLLRRHLRYRAWRFVHWFAYLAWPLAFVHSLYSGDDTRIGAVALVYWACLGLVVAGVALRLALGTRPLEGRLSPALVPVPVHSEVELLRRRQQR